MGDLRALAFSAGREFLNAADIAERLRVSQQQVRRWCESGRVQAERTPGGTWRIPSSQFKGLCFFVPKGRKRRSIRTVAGAWKDHPELLQAARDRVSE